MPYTVTAENAAVTGLKDAGAHISLHTADPGTSGASEVTGGAYARKATTWGTVSGSAVTGSAVTLDVPAGTTITHWGLWSALTAGNFLYGGSLPASEVFGSNGTYSLTPTLSASD
jgi:hypothetical protein